MTRPTVVFLAHCLGSQELLHSLAGMPDSVVPVVEPRFLERTGYAGPCLVDDYQNLPRLIQKLDDWSKTTGRPITGVLGIDDEFQFTLSRSVARHFKTPFHDDATLSIASPVSVGRRRDRVPQRAQDLDRERQRVRLPECRLRRDRPLRPRPSAIDPRCGAGRQYRRPGMAARYSPDVPCRGISDRRQEGRLPRQRPPRRADPPCPKARQRQARPLRRVLPDERTVCAGRRGRPGRADADRREGCKGPGSHSRRSDSRLQAVRTRSARHRNLDPPRFQQLPGPGNGPGSMAIRRPRLPPEEGRRGFRDRDLWRRRARSSIFLADGSGHLAGSTPRRSRRPSYPRSSRDLALRQASGRGRRLTPRSQPHLSIQGSSSPSPSPSTSPSASPSTTRWPRCSPDQNPVIIQRSHQSTSVIIRISQVVAVEIHHFPSTRRNVSRARSLAIEASNP